MLLLWNPGEYELHLRVPVNNRRTINSPFAFLCQGVPLMSCARRSTVHVRVSATHMGETARRQYDTIRATGPGRRRGSSLSHIVDKLKRGAWPTTAENETHEILALSGEVGHNTGEQVFRLSFSRENVPVVLKVACSTRAVGVTFRIVAALFLAENQAGGPPATATATAAGPISSSSSSLPGAIDAAVALDDPTRRLLSAAVQAEKDGAAEAPAAPSGTPAEVLLLGTALEHVRSQWANNLHVDGPSAVGSQVLPSSTDALGELLPGTPLLSTDTVELEGEEDLLTDVDTDEDEIDVESWKSRSHGRHGGAVRTPSSTGGPLSTKSATDVDTAATEPSQGHLERSSSTGSLFGEYLKNTWRLPPLSVAGRHFREIRAHKNSDKPLRASAANLPPHATVAQPSLTSPTSTAGVWVDTSDVRDETLHIPGRIVVLRGVNLGGNVKLPMGVQSQQRTDWSQLKDPEYCANLSWVGRPFPLQEAHQHLSRLERWGFNCVRLLVTWEAIEHAGPGQYDTDYLDYVEEVVRLAGRYNLYVFVDPHQDVWSRMTGGSGAPAWTFEVAGLDVGNLEACEAAFTHGNTSPGDDPHHFPRMTWPQNYQRFAALHMFTLFFGGNDFAPHFMVGGGKPDGHGSVPIQEYLQSHFINAMMQVAQRVAKFTHVLGFDSFNEPSSGFIGLSLDKNPEQIIPPGKVFRPFDAMATAAGFPVRVKVANGVGMLTSSVVANPMGVSCWLAGHKDVWQAHGVWETRPGAGGRRQPVLLRPDYFTQQPMTGKPVSFFRDFLRPFMVRYISVLRTVLPRAILFGEGDAFGTKEFVWDPAIDGPNVVNATHWYDGATLFLRQYRDNFSIDTATSRPVFGKRRVRELHQRDLASIQNLPHTPAGRPIAIPTLLGEFGIPYDLNKKVGFRKGDFRAHIAALTLYYEIIDELLLSSTQWNYCAGKFCSSPCKCQQADWLQLCVYGVYRERETILVCHRVPTHTLKPIHADRHPTITDNSNEWGDQWNLEDLSIFSPDQQSEPFERNPDSGGRAVLGFCRPYAMFTAGMPVSMRFDQGTGIMEYVYLPSLLNFIDGDPSTATVVYVPHVQFAPSDMLAGKSAGDVDDFVGFDVEVSNGVFRSRPLDGRHLLYVWATEVGTSQEALEAIVVRVSRLAV